jgi:translation initiation factor 2 beta subunit (eIF-2beta)/eIF-5
MKITWQCKYCKDIVTSDTKEHHKMDFCKCNACGVDLEKEYMRIAANKEDDVIILKRIEDK